MDIAGPTDIAPERTSDVVDAVADALRAGERIEIRGGGSRAGVGFARPSRRLLTSRLSGVIAYDPAELVITARAGTALTEIEDLLAREGQMLAFEPFGLLGAPQGGARGSPSTLGGIVGAGIAGSRRLSAGSVRDHLLGFEAVSGLGQRFVAGAKVVKNVTGYDLPKLAANSWGRLFVLTEVTFKALPRPQAAATVALRGLSASQACQAMSRAMGSQADVQAAGHAPAFEGGAVTAFRLEGFAPSVAARVEMLRGLGDGDAEVLLSDAADRFWSDLRDLAPLSDGRPLWRVNTPPSGGAKVVAALAPLGATWLMDWAGGLTWLTFDGDPGRMREAATAAGGHAALWRADDDMRRATPAFHPPAAGVAAIERRVRAAFDPEGVFETGRFLDSSDAD